MKKKYKINLHILEACNFRCRQCFSKFGTKKLLPVEDWKKIVDNCIAGAVNIAETSQFCIRWLVEMVQYMRNKEVVSDFAAAERRNCRCVPLCRMR